MAKKTTAKKQDSALDPTTDIPEDLGCKLRKLVIRNFGCIGATPVEIDLDDVVVLVGANNTGKSTILHAYDVLFSSSSPKLTIEDFPECKVNPGALPEIELHTMVTNMPPGHRWIGNVGGETVVRERWRWSSPNEAPKRQGFDVIAGDWSDQVPWGAPNVANARRPKPCRIEAFASPEKQTEAVTKLLLTTLQSRVKGAPITTKDENGQDVVTDYGKLLTTLGEFQKSVVQDVQQEIDAAQLHMTELVQNVFHGYQVEFDAKPEEDLATCLNFFKPGATLRMGPEDGHKSAAEKQGSGARRTLMWAALRYEAETNTADGEGHLRSNMLLLDEPELCLHPSAIREACSVLYDLPQTGRWQVMVTTHSPAFIDLSRDNTTVVRVERDVENDVIKGTTVFRPQKANLSADDKEELKMLNLCDPHVFEFFFGGNTVLVEGDTEYTAFKYVMSKSEDDAKLRDIHIVRARGKSILRLLAGILNQFNASYAVLHDSDAPTVLKKQKNAAQPVEIVNPAWTNNVRILEAVAQAVAEDRVRLVALVPNFEHALLGKEAADDKPYNAWSALRDNEALCQKVRGLLYGLTNFADALPEECIDWQQEEVLRQKWTDWNSDNNP